MFRKSTPHALRLMLSEQDVLGQLSAMAFGEGELAGPHATERLRGRKRPLGITLCDRDVTDQLPAMALASEGWVFPDRPSASEGNA